MDYIPKVAESLETLSEIESNRMKVQGTPGYHRYVLGRLLRQGEFYWFVFVFYLPIWFLVMLTAELGMGLPPTTFNYIVSIVISLLAGFTIVSVIGFRIESKYLRSSKKDHDDATKFLNSNPRAMLLLREYQKIEAMGNSSIYSQYSGLRAAVTNAYAKYLEDIRNATVRSYENRLNNKLEQVRSSSPGLVSMNGLALSDVQDVVRPRPRTRRSKRVGVLILNLLRNRLHQHVK